MGKELKKDALPLLAKTSGTVTSTKDFINSRQTQELVLAFCGAVGSGVSTIARDF